MTKIQTVALVAIIVVAAVGGVFAYILLGGEGASGDPIKIGVCADLDAFAGKSVWEGAQLAVEHLNEEGGLLGRQVTVIGEDSDSESSIDLTTTSDAMLRLITHHEVDFIFAGAAGGAESP